MTKTSGKLKNMKKSLGEIIQPFLKKTGCTDRKKKTEIIIKGIVLCTAAGWLFLGNIAGVLISLAAFPVYFFKKAEQEYEKQKMALRVTFRDAINLIYSGLESGENPEKAFSEALSELGIMYSEDNEIVRGFEGIVSKLENSVSLEKAFSEFAEKTDIEEISYFSEILLTAKRTGGNLLWIIRETRGLISDRIELESELKTMISAKAFEAGIMKIIPLAVLLYLRLLNYEMVEPLYTTQNGIILMSVSLPVYFALTLVTDKIAGGRVRF